VSGPAELLARSEQAGHSIHPDVQAKLLRAAQLRRLIPEEMRALHRLQETIPAHSRELAALELEMKETLKTAALPATDCPCELCRRARG